jgi:hypothetical protein
MLKEYFSNTQASYNIDALTATWMDGVQLGDFLNTTVSGRSTLLLRTRHHNNSLARVRIKAADAAVTFGVTFTHELLAEAGKYTQ